VNRRVRLRSLAKINLDLRILNKRPDGFHELRTVFQTISLADTIEIEFQLARKTELTIAGNVEIADNLVLRAATKLLEAMRVYAHVQFRLTKRIPMGGGLGGGSSNAAAVLLALPVLAGKPVAVQEIAAALGSDVPFFLEGGTAVAIGRGTEFYSLPDIAEQPILVVSPGLHVATGPAYAALGRGLTFTESSNKINSFQEFVRALGERRRADLASALSGNDFESVVFRQYPKLKTILGKLSKTGAARMTGSGSSLFGIYESEERRESARKVLEGDRGFGDGQVIAAQLVSRANYRRLWKRQLRDHLDPNADLWPPRSRYAR
jgi:4-diphosphocytidyl-2-C-methyl-D-erythritol kinase